MIDFDDAFTETAKPTQTGLRANIGALVYRYSNPYTYVYGKLEPKKALAKCYDTYGPSMKQKIEKTANGWKCGDFYVVTEVTEPWGRV